MTKMDDFIIVEKKDTEFDLDENISLNEEIRKKRKTKGLKNIEKDFKNTKADKIKAKNGNNFDVKNNKNNLFNENSNEKILNKISFDDGIKLSEEKSKNKKSFKTKNMKEDQSDNHPLIDKGSEKIDCENLDVDNSSIMNALKDYLNPDNFDYFKDDCPVSEKINCKLHKDEKIYKYNNKNKINKYDSSNLNNNNLIDKNNANYISNKKVKNKKEKLEKLEKMEKPDTSIEGENSNPINNDCIKNIEIPSNNYIKSKRSVYKNCLYCKNDKINIMTILRFKSSEEFIFYSRHFYEKLTEENLKKYKESKNNFERYYNDYYKKCSQSNNFTFKSIKYICISCFEENLKDENGFSNILNTLQYGLNPPENKIRNEKSEENNNINSNNKSHTNESVIENKKLSMDPIIDLNFISGDKVELLKHKKKYIKKKFKINSEGIFSN